ncbi:hypothetical protein F2Q69_00046147 [Brassica cretica]|uniref:Uncharacterized protein n=1 Tax=Brassica cretica TaxID=69181 RepID=A0A8S9PRP6_BRACR|nr:hypothetical protein F2Q69_00046147 [Brassica cretica]
MQWEMTKDTTMAPERSPLELLRESRSSIEEIISRMLSIKKQGDPKSENRELVTQMFLNFINLRQTPDPKSHKLVMLTFEYLLKLNLVCVGIEESQEDILCDLFPDDAGLEPPHQSTKLILGDDHAFDESRTSRPYKWGQHLAGIEVLPEMSPFVTGKDTQNSDTASVSDHYSVQTVLRRVRSQKKRLS